ncbi:MAG: hypothetical protein Q7T08_05555 [Devosia sp.]|nr:hypothetical protein [Devosia sp.]
MATADTTDITLEVLKRIQADQAAHRQETRAIQQSFIDLARLVQRLDARMSDIKADLETMFKMEIIGQMAHLETRLESTFFEKLGAIAVRLDSIDGKLSK